MSWGKYSPMLKRNADIGGGETCTPFPPSYRKGNCHRLVKRAINADG